jgi:hypothetical protein
MKRIIRLVIILLILTGGFASVYAYEGYVGRFVYRVYETYWPIKPCSRTIKYNIGILDSRFGLSKQEFMRHLSRAETVWEDSFGKNYFEYSENDGLTVNLIYDARQETTETLQDLGAKIDASIGNYDLLKSKYESARITYERTKQEIASLKAQYESAISALNADIDKWNKKGGAPRQEYETLEREKQRIVALQSDYNAKIAYLNKLAESLNEMAHNLNRIAKELNLKVQTYNDIGATTGPEFDEGEYVLDHQGERINIYQYENEIMFVRVLAHELGHALGLSHVENEDSVMNRLNDSDNLYPTEEDIKELLSVCRI